MNRLLLLIVILLAGLLLTLTTSLNTTSNQDADHQRYDSPLGEWILEIQIQDYYGVESILGIEIPDGRGTLDLHSYGEGTVRGILGDPRDSNLRVEGDLIGSSIVRIDFKSGFNEFVLNYRVEFKTSSDYSEAVDCNLYLKPSKYFYLLPSDWEKIGSCELWRPN